MICRRCGKEIERSPKLSEAHEQYMIATWGRHVEAWTDGMYVVCPDYVTLHEPEPPEPPISQEAVITGLQLIVTDLR